MSWILRVADFFIHIDRYLGLIIAQVGGGTTSALLGVLVFVETGLVIFPFLPGDSVMFAAGALAAQGHLSMVGLYPALVVAAILGNTANYLFGHACRDLIKADKEIRWIRRDHLRDAQDFYAKHGTKMVILARFIPVVRSFAPFVAGVAEMPYMTFLWVNAVGGIIWVSLFLWGGYFFGNIAFVKEHFSVVVAAIVIVSLVPLLYEAMKRKRGKKTA
ncbi:VTT domain-containing protein [Patescibacteria group bacterium]|nr:VTT domain-containing protein [Patescibacteria group bacterium]